MDSRQIFFDLDDTLVNTRETIYKRIGVLLDQFQLETNPNQIYDLLGFQDREDSLKDLVKNPGSFWKRYEQLRKKVKVSSFPGINQTLKKLHSKKIPLGIITNNGREKTLEKLASAGIRSNLFTNGIYSCSENNCHKPSPEIAKMINLSPENILYVGDDLIDYEFAQNIGTDFYGVCSGLCGKKDFLRSGLRVERIFPSVKNAFE
jgi:HAD superfamily hydrolase (TIGR01549 family)